MRVHDLQVSHEPVGSLNTYHRNPRRGNTQVIRESLTVNGQYRPLVVNRGTHTGRPNEVLAGNHTLMAARQAEWDEIQVCWLDVDDEAAARIVAADNRTTDLADYDDSTLVELLQELGGYEGTGYTVDDVDNLAAALEEQAVAMPPAEGATTGQPGASEPFRVEVDGQPANRTTLEERAALYSERDTRSMYLTFLLPEFEWVVPRLGSLAEKFGVETHTDAVLHLVANATGDDLPEAVGERNRAAPVAAP